MSAAPATEEPTPEDAPKPKPKRSKAPPADNAKAELSKAFALLLDETDAVVEKADPTGYRKREKDGVELFAFKLKLKFDIGGQLGALPYAEALKSLHDAQAELADAGAKQTIELKISRNFANGVIYLEDQVMKQGATLSYDIAGKPTVKMVGESKLVLTMNAIAEVATLDDVGALLRIKGRDIKGTLKPPAQTDLFD